MEKLLARLPPVVGASLSTAFGGTAAIATRYVIGESDAVALAFLRHFGCGLLVAGLAWASLGRRARIARGRRLFDPARRRGAARGGRVARRLRAPGLLQPIRLARGAVARRPGGRAAVLPVDLGVRAHDAGAGDDHHRAQSDHRRDPGG